MSRIEKAYHFKFSALLRRLNARQPEKAWRWFQEKARHLAVIAGFSYQKALTLLYQKVARRVRTRFRTSACHDASATHPIRFVCDVGLGGLARWLRAAGYEAEWFPGISDAALAEKGRATGACLLTTDSLLMERRVVRNGEVQALWVPPTITMLEQLELVLDELGLPVLESRCMACGGDLQLRRKEELKSQIPPRTYLWLDEFWVCSRCGKLYWHGTHWEKIKDQIHKLSPRFQVQPDAKPQF